MPDSPLKILFVVSEALPFAKTGGLADVAGSLPVALRALGHDVRLVMPCYRTVREGSETQLSDRRPLEGTCGGPATRVGYRAGSLAQLPVYFIDAPELFDRAGLYGEQGVDYPDNAIRFGLFGRAALALARQLDFCPDIVHAHDWQAATTLISLKHQFPDEPFFAHTGSLLTIHNLGYQGLFAKEVLADLDLDTRLFTIDQLEYHGQVSLLKGGIVCADRVNTVSPTYCREIQTQENGMGLDGLLRHRRTVLSGILNGLDTALWNPASDPALPNRYTATRPGGKQDCKRALQEELGLQPRADLPLAAMVTRLDPQKGLDLLLPQWETILQRPLQLVILGSGHPDYQDRLAALTQRYPGRTRLLQGFDEALAHRIYAGSDLFLMPSRYEPCGLGQLIALRYGSLPLVHATGGLADTIIDPRDNPERANGYRFEEYSADALLEGLDRILAAYAVGNGWQAMMQRGMQQDLSWNRAACDYLALYRQIVEEKYD